MGVSMVERYEDLLKRAPQGVDNIIGLYERLVKINEVYLRARRVKYPGGKKRYSLSSRSL